MKTLSRINALARKAGDIAHEHGWTQPANVETITLALALEELEARIEARLAAKVDRAAVGVVPQRSDIKVRLLELLNNEVEKRTRLAAGHWRDTCYVEGRISILRELLRSIDRGEL